MFALSDPKKAKHSAALNVLFVGVSEEDTAFLTKGAPLDVVHRSSSFTGDLPLEEEHFDALVLDVVHAKTGSIRSLKQCAATPVFVLADAFQVPQAIQLVKEGADGFLVRGITNPNSFFKLAKMAKARS